MTNVFARRQHRRCDPQLQIITVRHSTEPAIFIVAGEHRTAATFADVDEVRSIEQG